MKTITLGRDERFELWGQRVLSLRYDPAGGDDQFVSLRGRDGFIGSVRPAECVEVFNIIETRRAP